MWCMACNAKNLSKKKIVILSSVLIVIAVASFYAYTVNSVITLAVLPFVLPFLVCIIMCGIMGGAMFLSGRLSKKSSEKSHHSCCTNQSEQMKESIKLESTIDDKKTAGS